MAYEAIAPFDENLQRVTDETCKAASYLTAALSPRLVPHLLELWKESPSQLAFEYMRQAAHMAFLVTLAALLEQSTKGGRVNLATLLRHLRDPQVRRMIAARCRIEPQRVAVRAELLQRRFTERIVPLIPRVKDVRDNVVAHHGRTTSWPESKVGIMTLLMVRVVVLVDAIHVLAMDDATNLRETISAVRYQSAALWSKGIDGDLDIGPGPSDEATVESRGG